MNEKIIDLLFQRSEIALKEISSKYGNLLHSIAYRVLPSYDDVEECINDTLLEIWNTVPPNNPDSISSYACMIVRRKAIDRVRFYTAKKRGGKEYELALSEIDECVFSVDEMALDENNLLDLIREFLDKLNIPERNIFMSRYFGFESINEIACKHSISENAINIRLSKIRKKLKIHLKERGVFI